MSNDATVHFERNDNRGMNILIVTSIVTCIHARHIGSNLINVNVFVCKFTIGIATISIDRDYFFLNAL